MCRKEDTISEPNENRGYFVTDAAGQKVEVCFETLTADDLDALNGDDWQGARFNDVWKDWAEPEIALKLVRCDGSDNAILGIVSIGTVRRLFGKAGFLKGSLLETAPIFRYNANQRRYRSIGKVLVTRMVVASKAHGTAGHLRISPVQGSLPSYAKLGFLPEKNRFHVLNAEKAEELLAEVRFLPEEERTE